MKKTKEEWKVQKNVFSLSSERNLFKLVSQGYFESIESPVMTGKESNIFSARRKDRSKVIIKIYRLENCNFNKMYEYIRPDPRYISLKKGKRNILFSWVQREFRNLHKAKAVVRVPEPHVYRDNIIVMEHIGKEVPASSIKYDSPSGSARTRMFNAIIKGIHDLYNAGLVHGDLSEFNILNLKGKPVFIDFSQGTLTRDLNSRALLERDVLNVCRFFSKESQYEKILASIIKK